MREGARRIGRRRRPNTTVDHESVGSELGLVGRLKNSLSIPLRGARRTGDLPKNCHLLPSTAILEPQNRDAPCNRFIRSLPFEAKTASLSVGRSQTADATACVRQAGHFRRIVLVSSIQPKTRSARGSSAAKSSLLGQA